MMTINDIKEYVACVNGGSGVIFQPADEGVTYILTAKHIFYDDNGQLVNTKVNIHYYSKPTNSMIAYPEFDLVTGDNFFSHTGKNVDIAILKISRIATPDKLIVTNNFLIDNTSYILGGYPNLRRDGVMPEVRFDENALIKQVNLSGRVEASLAKNQTYEELVGMSGGGFFKLNSDYILLAGIQSQIPNKKESLGAVEFTPLEIFNEIIDSSDKLLEKIVPSYLKSFSFLISNCFSLAGGIHSSQVVEKVTAVLIEQTKFVIESDYTPLCIKEHLGYKQMLIDSKCPSDIFKKTLWVAWLELLTILNIAKRPVITKKNDFEELFSNVRFFYSDIDKDFWTEHIEDLLNANYSGLKMGGLVVVATRRPASDGEHVLNAKGLLPNIAQTIKIYDEENTPSSNVIAIDNPASNPFMKFRFANISAFKELEILEKYSQFQNMGVAEIVIKLKELYEQLIT
jgi:hypothetical protein